MEQQRAHDRDRTWVEWMRAANAGDEIAYHRLLEALAPFLRAVVRRGFTRSGFGNCDVEDVVQETLLAIHLKRQTWDEDEALTPWVMAIARHKLIDSLRRRGRHIELPIDDLIDVLPAEIPTETLSSRDAERLLSVLTGRQRDVVRAISIEGMSAREAAHRFRMSEGAVRVALHRGLTTLVVSCRDLDQ
jgi:RNA polymerase sigma-70 factor (ECF subfamily)